MSLFPERQEAVSVLYQAAARLLDNASYSEGSISRSLNRDISMRCLDLADKIGRMGSITIHVGGGVVEQVDGIPFSLGYKAKDLDDQESARAEAGRSVGEADDKS